MLHHEGVKKNSSMKTTRNKRFYSTSKRASKFCQQQNLMPREFCIPFFHLNSWLPFFQQKKTKKLQREANLESQPSSREPQIFKI